MATIEKVIDLALEEDIGSGDITTKNLIDKNQTAKAEIIAKEPLVIAGVEIAKKVFLKLDPNTIFTSKYNDKDFIKEKEVILEVQASMQALLIGERTALNFLQHLSGIATHVRNFVDKLQNKKCRIVDTRKTTPVLRMLEKYAVRVGGAYNHRMGLFDGILIKDNHIALAGGIKQAIEKIRKNVSHMQKIEVEVSNISEVLEAVEAGADIIMLDNMNIDEIKDAIKLIDGKALVEVSGGIKKDDINQLSNIGVDIISIGALTHSARSVDISMRIS